MWARGIFQSPLLRMHKQRPVFTQNSESDSSVLYTSLLKKSGDIFPSNTLPWPYHILVQSHEVRDLLLPSSALPFCLQQRGLSVSFPLTKGGLQAEFLLYCSQQVGLF